MIKQIHEIFHEIGVAKTEQQQINILKQNQSKALEIVLFYGFNKKIQFYRTTPPKEYKPNSDPVGLTVSNIYSEWKMFRYFILGYTECDRLSEKKKDQMLIQLLESFTQEEANVVLYMMKHQFEAAYGIKETMVKKIFPWIIDTNM